MYLGTREAKMPPPEEIWKPTSSMVSRMTAILDTFDSSHCCRSLQDIASSTGLPRSTAHRILEQLVQLGWVQHSITGYRLGWRANRLPSRANEESQLRAVAAPHIQILAATTGLIVHLAVLDGAAVRYLDKIGSGASVVPSRVGGSLPAHLTAVGKATLAYVDPEFLDALLGGFARGSTRSRSTANWRRCGCGAGCRAFATARSAVSRASARRYSTAGTGSPAGCHCATRKTWRRLTATRRC
jgi:DNA-binding IclR family transcriptional regulator